MFTDHLHVQGKEGCVLNCCLYSGIPHAPNQHNGGRKHQMLSVGQACCVSNLGMEEQQGGRDKAAVLTFLFSI